MENNFNYSAVIRTLGTAGNKYQQLLDSLNKQTIKPVKILVYIAEGYPLPKETIGKEEYIYVKKGMVAQRALDYKEVNSEYILFLDDDLSFPPDTVEKMFHLLKATNADVISPDIFPNAKRTFFSEVLMTLSGRMIARKKDDYWGYKVMRNSGYSYNKNPKKEIYYSQTNSGACLLCSKSNFLKISFRDELWLDNVVYPVGEDQVMYYKMYLKGLKLLTWYNHNFIHLDAGNNMDKSKKKNVIYSDFRFKTIFWHRFIYKPDNCLISKLLSFICILYTLLFTLMISLVKLDIGIFKLKFRAIMSAVIFIISDEYKNIPSIIKVEK